MSTTEPLNVRLPSPPPSPAPLSDDETGPGSVETVIRPRPGWIAVNWGELAHSHELFYTLVSRDLKIRYKQTVLGVAWAVIQPICTMIVFTIIFSRMAGIKTGDIAYPLFSFAALVPWTFFSNAVSGAALSLLTHQNLLTKIYFPRLYVPAATVGGFLVDLAIGLSLFAILMPLYRFTPGWGLLALPPMILLVFAAALGVGLTLAAATIQYRDLRFVIPFALQLLIFVSGVMIPMDQLDLRWRLLAAFNPMFGIISGFRSSILGTPWDFGPLAVSTLATAGLLVFGLFFFRKTERLIADIA